MGTLIFKILADLVINKTSFHFPRGVKISWKKKKEFESIVETKILRSRARSFFNKVFNEVLTIFHSNQLWSKTDSRKEIYICQKILFEVPKQSYKTVHIFILLLHANIKY